MANTQTEVTIECINQAEYDTVVALLVLRGASEQAENGYTKNPETLTIVIHEGGTVEF
jgi:hypothetical protein